MKSTFSLSSATPYLHQCPFRLNPQAKTYQTQPSEKSKKKLASILSSIRSSLSDTPTIWCLTIQTCIWSLIWYRSRPTLSSVNGSWWGVSGWTLKSIWITLMCTCWIECSCRRRSNTKVKVSNSTASKTLTKCTPCGKSSPYLRCQICSRQNGRFSVVAFLWWMWGVGEYEQFTLVYAD